MATIVEPTEAQLRNLVAPYLRAQPTGLGFAIGYASPGFANHGNVYLFGNMQNQFGDDLVLDRKTTPFQIASITKTFTATLYARLLREPGHARAVGDFMSPKGPFTNEYLAKIKLEELVNYTSGLPQDNTYDAVAVPPYHPQPYSLQGMISFLNAAPPQLSWPGERYTYSNLAFAIMSAIIAADGTDRIPPVHAFIGKMRDHIFAPLGLDAKFFNHVSLAELPLGFHYDYWPSSGYASPGYWPKAPGHPFYPAYFGAHGIVAAPDDMFKWLQFNMDITTNNELTPLLPALQTPATPVTTDDPANTTDWNRLGLGWFIDSPDADRSGSVFKDGELDGCNSYIAFVPSPDPGNVPSPAGAFVLVNADGIMQDGREIPLVLSNDLLLMMQGKAPPADKSLYPSSARKRA
jgi:D-alanyl-D-alanine-carboxypeptidase/D-alanyl-D-alanine-endopeptidase